MTSYYWFVFKGRFPRFEVRKINSEAGENKVHGKAFMHNSSDETDKVVEDGPEMNEESTTLDELISEIPPGKGESSAQDKLPVHVFVYGVR